MTRDGRKPDSPPSKRDPSAAESCPPDDSHVVIIHPNTKRTNDRYAVDQLFTEWAWSARFKDDWDGALRALACTLRGLEGAGLIERRTVRRTGHPTHHGFRLTELGREALDALSGDWIKEGPA